MYLYGLHYILESDFVFTLRHNIFYWKCIQIFGKVETIYAVISGQKLNCFDKKNFQFHAIQDKIFDFPMILSKRFSKNNEKHFTSLTIMRKSHYK